MSDITAASLEAMLADIRKTHPPLPPDPFNALAYRPFSFAGLDIIERPEQPPLLRVSDEVPMSDKARAAMNVWLLERFGRRPDFGPMIFAGRYLSVTRADKQWLFARIEF